MKQLLSAMLLVAVVAVTGCGDAKKPAAKPATEPAKTEPAKEAPKTP